MGKSKKKDFEEDFKAGWLVFLAIATVIFFFGWLTGNMMTMYQMDERTGVTITYDYRLDDREDKHRGWSMSHEIVDGVPFENATVVISSDKDFSLLNCWFKNCNITFNKVYERGGAVIIGGGEMNINGSYFHTSNIFMTIWKGDVVFDTSIMHDCVLFKDGLRMCNVNTID